MKMHEGGVYGALEDLFGPLFVTIPIVRVLIGTIDWTMTVVVHIYLVHF